MDYCEYFRLSITLLLLLLLLLRMNCLHCSWQCIIGILS